MKLNDSNLFRQQALINGEWLDANNGEAIDVTNPANGDKLGSVPKMGADETRAAIDAANRALPAWRALTAKERATILRNWFNLMMEHQDDLARLMTLEQGKPLAEAKGEISYAASFIEWFAEEGKRIYGDTIPGHQADKRLIVIKQPIGRHRGYHAVELPGGDDYPQSRSGAGSRLHHGAEARQSDAVLCAGAGGAGDPRGRSGWGI